MAQILTTDERTRISAFVRSRLPVQPVHPPVGYYVYLISLGNVARYVGKGVGFRAWNHFDFTASLVKDPGKEPSQQLYRFMIEALKAKKSVDLTIIRQAMTESAAFDLEKSMVNRMGRALLNSGTLLNLADGGVAVGKDFSLARKLHENGVNIYALKHPDKKRARPGRTTRRVGVAAFGPFGSGA